MNPISQLQFVVFVLGLFYLKMAVADAIWRILIEPSAIHVDSGSFEKLLSTLYSNDSLKLISNTKFY